MKMSMLLAPTMRTDPAEAEIASHRLMLRAGLVRRAASGVYTFLPLAQRVLARIEEIIREEMDASGGQEVRLPIVQSAEIWQKTGRWDEYGAEMFKLKDRHERQFCLGPTHEEIITTLVSDEVHSYRGLPLLLYQIQNKYRDEIRPRFGVMRSREFVMKDLYSFDRDQAGLDASYKAMYDAYIRVFDRCRVDFRIVQADSGAMGGDTTHEFMALAQSGEALIIHCPDCDYAANQERAEARADVPDSPEQQPEQEEVHTPGAATIEDVARFLGISPRDTAKTLFYWSVPSGSDPQLVAVVLRGDRQVNEIKVANHLGSIHLTMASDDDIKRETGSSIGFAGPQDLEGVRILVDRELALQPRVVIGANRPDYHLTGAVPGVTFPTEEQGDFRLAQAGDACIKCEQSLSSQRGIEVGQVFQLGTKYSEALGATFTDQDGSERLVLMGSYGIGVTRTMAAIIEQNHDDRGIIWPRAVAPYQVVIVVINSENEEQLRAGEGLYQELREAGISTVLDERPESPGVKFSDADMMGFPLRITVGPRSLKEGQCEIKVRRTAEEAGVDLDKAMPRIVGMVTSAGGPTIG